MKAFIKVLLFLLIPFGLGTIYAQPKAAISAYPNFTALDFIFTEEASLPWYISIDSLGNYVNTIGQEVLDTDTLPQHHTAQIFTNIHGGFTIRHAYPYLSSDTLVVIFQDGLPDLNSGFTLYKHQDSFWVKPDIFHGDWEDTLPSITVIQQSLQWYHDPIAIQSFAYLDFHFQVSNMLTPYYFKGFFKVDY